MLNPPPAFSAGIAEVWIVNLDAHRLEIYTQPQGAAYTVTQVVQRGETVADRGAAGGHADRR